MADTTETRANSRGARIGAVVLILSLLLPAAALAGANSDEDSYFYPLLGKFTRTDEAPGITVEEKGENYGVGVFFRTPIGTRMQGSANVEEATEGDRRFIANARVELDYVRADVSATADNNASLNTVYKGISAASTTAEAKYRILRGEGDVGYRVKTGYGPTVEPFLGLGYIYRLKDTDGGPGFRGFTEYAHILHARPGVRAEIELGRELWLTAEIGLRFPLVTRIKENLAPTVSFRPGMGMSDAETLGLRYAQYRVFLFHERLSFQESTGGGGLIRPESKEQTFGIRLGFGY